MERDNFTKETLSAEESFWVMWYFLKGNYELSGGSFNITDILSASEPLYYENTDIKTPADSAMISFWNEAIERFRNEGIPTVKNFKK